MCRYAFHTYKEPFACLVMMSAAVILGGCARTEKRAAAPRRVELAGTPAGINLARTSLAYVRATSVNGGRGQDNKFYGVRNAFDDGRNWHNGINYTYWLSDPGDLSPSIEVRFDTPVSVTSIVVERGPGFTAMIVNERGREIHYPPAADVLILAEPAGDVRRIRLSFESSAQPVKVHEVRILGGMPEGSSFDASRPRLLR